jgi:hypothetical protein
MNRSIPPVIVKHHIFERLEKLSRDWEKVCSLRERLERRASAEEIVERFVANGVCDAGLGRLLLEHWIGGERFPAIRERCLEIARLIGEDGPYLSAWWVLGLSKRVRVEHLLLDDSIVLLLLTPHLSLEEVIAKGREGIDPTGPRLAAAYQGAIGIAMAEGREVARR